MKNMKKIAENFVNFGCACFAIGITMLIIMFGFCTWNIYGWIGTIILFSFLLVFIGACIIIIVPFQQKD